MDTHRQRIEAAFSQSGASHVAPVICYEGIYVRDHWQQLTAAPWWHQQSMDADQQLAWRWDVLAKTGHGWFELPVFTAREERADTTISERQGGVFLTNRRTGEERQLLRPTVGGWTDGIGVQSVHPRSPVETIGDVERDIPPAQEFDPARAGEEGIDDLARELIRRHADRYPLGYVAAPLWRLYHVWGFEGLMELIATRPELVRYACDRLQVEAIQQVRQAAWLGAAGIWIEDCLTDMIHPRDFAALNAPYVRGLVEEIHQSGMHSIHYFCGNPAGKWQALLSTGIDALALEESKKGFVIDIDEVVERVQGRCTVLGNLDAIGILQDGDVTMLRAEIQRQIRAGQRNGGRFVMSLGSPVTPGTPVERVRLYCDLVNELGEN